MPLGSVTACCDHDGVGFSERPVSARGFSSPCGRLTGFADPVGVCTFRRFEMRSGWMASIPQRHRRPRVPFSSGNPLGAASGLPRPCLCIAVSVAFGNYPRCHRGFTFVHPCVLSLARFPRATGYFLRRYPPLSTLPLPIAPRRIGNETGHGLGGLCPTLTRIRVANEKWISGETGTGGTAFRLGSVMCSIRVTHSQARPQWAPPRSGTG